MVVIHMFTTCSNEVQGDLSTGQGVERPHGARATGLLPNNDALHTRLSDVLQGRQPRAHAAMRLATLGAFVACVRGTACATTGTTGPILHS